MSQLPSLTTPCTHFWIGAFVRYTCDGFVRDASRYSAWSLKTNNALLVHHKPMHSSSKHFSGLRKIPREITSPIEIVVNE